VCTSVIAGCDTDRITKLAGKSTRPGVHKCKECAKPFKVTVGTIFEDSKIPLNKWQLAFCLLSGGKMGFSAPELHRALDITYKSAWFLCHRIRKAMDGADGNGPLVGPNEVVETDETYVGGKAKNRAFREPAPKKAVMALVTREAGQVVIFSSPK
jgi:transposase-like protein